MKLIYADLHIHIGGTKDNRPVKITASRSMTFREIIREASHRKGIQMIGVIDAQSPPVQKEIEEGLICGDFQEHPDGGIVFNHTTCILGAEIELKEPGCGAFHVLTYFPTLCAIKKFTLWISTHMKNPQLSTQRLYQTPRSLQEKVLELGGIIIPAHIFTPFKSVYGSSGSPLHELFDLHQLAGVELGLSSDSHLADQINELGALSFLTNSDAHSLPKIGREYNELWVREASFLELTYVLSRKYGRKIVANYGLNPKLGKYYRTRCIGCSELWGTCNERCEHCGETKYVKGVRERIEELTDQTSAKLLDRPPYVYQVPLEFIPGLGKKGLEKLLSVFHTEMHILHQAPLSEIALITNQNVAKYIQFAREERLHFHEGGGGIYGKVSGLVE